MTPAELVTLLQDFYRETSELLLSRQARARSVTSYEANNAYQQVLGRQDVHLRWVSDAITDLGGTIPEVGIDESEASAAKGTDVNTIVDESYVRKIVPRLKAAGATGIVEYPISKIID